jgi:hypothetical protein
VETIEAQTRSTCIQRLPSGVIVELVDATPVLVA